MEIILCTFTIPSLHTTEGLKYSPIVHDAPSYIATVTLIYCLTISMFI